MFNFIKANKPIKRVISNLTSTSEEVMANAKSRYTRELKTLNDQTQGLFNSVQKKAANGTQTAKDLMDLQKSAEKSGRYSAFASTGIFDGKYDKAVAQDLRDEIYKDIYRDNGRRMVETGVVGRNLTDYYFGAGVGREQQLTRLGATGLGVAGVGIGARYLSGGSMTRNNKGEKDVAVIPFI